MIKIPYWLRNTSWRPLFRGKSTPNKAKPAGDIPLEATGGAGSLAGSEAEQTLAQSVSAREYGQQLLKDGDYNVFLAARRGADALVKERDYTNALALREETIAVAKECNLVPDDNLISLVFAFGGPAIEYAIWNTANDKLALDGLNKCVQYGFQASDLPNILMDAASLKQTIKATWPHKKVSDDQSFFLAGKVGAKGIAYAESAIPNAHDRLKAILISANYGVSIQDISLVATLSEKVGMQDSLMAAKFYRASNTAYPENPITFKAAYEMWQLAEGTLSTRDYDNLNPLELLVLGDTQLFSVIGRPNILVTPVDLPIDEELVRVTATAHKSSERPGLRSEGGRVPGDYRDALLAYYRSHDAKEGELDLQSMDPSAQVGIPVILRQPGLKAVCSEMIEAMEKGDKETYQAGLVRLHYLMSTAPKNIGSRMPQHNFVSTIGTPQASIVDKL